MIHFQILIMGSGDVPELDEQLTNPRDYIPYGWTKENWQTHLAAQQARKPTEHTHEQSEKTVDWLTSVLFGDKSDTKKLINEDSDKSGIEQAVSEDDPNTDDWLPDLD